MVAESAPPDALCRGGKRNGGLWLCGRCSRHVVRWARSCLVCCTDGLLPTPYICPCAPMCPHFTAAPAAKFTHMRVTLHLLQALMASPGPQTRCCSLAFPAPRPLSWRQCSNTWRRWRTALLPEPGSRRAARRAGAAMVCMFAVIWPALDLDRRLVQQLTCNRKFADQCSWYCSSRHSQM
jgi:hypothetical protein